MTLTPNIKQLLFRSIIVFLVKMIGAFVRIPLFRMLGAEGVGLYQMIYSFYGLILTIVTGGIPTTITLYTAQNRQLGLKMLKASVILLALIGLSVGLLCHAFAYRLAAIIGDGRLEWPIKFVAPAIVLVPILSAIRGYMQGLENYSRLAISELIEQVFRVLTILLLASLWISHSLSLAVSGAAFGAVIGAWIALCYLLIMMRYAWTSSSTRSSFHKQENKLTLFSFIWLIRASLTITVARLIMPLADFMDALIIPHRLQHAGATGEAATAIYGIFTGMAASLVYMPTLVSSAVSHIYAAKIAADWKRGDYVRFQRRSMIILQLGWLWGGGCSFYLYYYHDELSKLLFGNDSASKAILYLCIAPLISGMRDLSTTILWAADKKKEPVKGLIYGIIAACIAGYGLIGIPRFSLEGIMIELLALEAVSAYWNLLILRKMNFQMIKLKQLLLETIWVSLVAWLCYKLGFFIAVIMHLPAVQATFCELFVSLASLFGYIVLRSWFTLERNTAA
jgi:stage V sporulation protein B